MNVHVHLHVCALDGVFVDDGGEGGACPRFVPAPPPTRTELSALLERVSARVTTWLRKHGHIRTDDELYASNDRPEPSFQEALALAGTQRGTLEKRRDDGEAEGDAADVRASAPKTDAVTHLGFNLHASVTIAANDDFGRERLFRYGLRPPFALSRMRMLSDGRVAYRVKKAGRGKASYRIMTPVECIARLCALVPPPRYPLTRFHGVLAPRSALRARVVPKLPTRAPACKVHASRKNEESPSPSPDPSPTPSGPTPSRRHEPVVPAAPPVGASALALALAIALPDAENPAPNVLSADHLARILGGLLYAATSAVPWALLLRRTFDADISTCARCGGRVRVRAVVTDHAVAAKILAAIDAGRARAPPPPPAAA